jgi:uncharacterized protein (TIGR03083 family)
MAETTSPSLDQVLAALTLSHERLVATVESLADDEVTKPSYDDDWTVAQVLSHLGSGAEIFGLILEAGAAGRAAPGGDAFHPVWDRWNAMSPPDQARNALASDTAFLERIAALPLPERDAWRLDFFGGQKDLTDMLRMRLGEHALHTWDVEVALVPDATVPADAVGLLVDTIGAVAARSGKPGHVTQVGVVTERPERRFVVESTADGVTLTPDSSDRDASGERNEEGRDATVRLPAEALVRLVYGRLDADHTPSTVVSEGVDLDDLRRTFPGL